MTNNKTEYPYCRRCNKTRDNPDEWAKFTTRGEPRKAACCGKCGQMLAWGPVSRTKYGKINLPQNIEKNKDTKIDIKENMHLWKQFLWGKFKLICPGCGNNKKMEDTKKCVDCTRQDRTIKNRILKEKEKWNKLK